jgi:hypothetical protein
MIAYTVRCTFEDPAVAAEWTEWLVSVHLAEVLAAGAIAAELVRLDGEDTVLEARYRFATRPGFAAYERDHAPRLRAEGLSRFPLSRGLRYERSVGEVLTAEPRERPGGGRAGRS